VNEDNLKRKRRLEELQLSIRAICSTLVSGFSVDNAIGVMKAELGELEQHKRAGQGPSEAFERAVDNSGAIVATCELCDRTHFVSQGDFEDGELEELREKARLAPDKYIEDGRYDMLDIGYLDGKQVVLGCPCAKVANYEAWIWSHRYIISKYLKLRADELEMDAKLAREVATNADAVVKAELRPLVV
jgi:hypothetical protein